MTRPRYDEHSTEFGKWIRNVPQLDSKDGWITTNLDYIWRCYKNEKWMFIEEKRHGTQIKYWQKQVFDVVDRACKNDSNYCGFHILIFENTSPLDGKMFWDGQEISSNRLIEILQLGYKPDLNKNNLE